MFFELLSISILSFIKSSSKFAFFLSKDILELKLLILETSNISNIKSNLFLNQKMFQIYLYYHN